MGRRTTNSTERFEIQLNTSPKANHSKLKPKSSVVNSNRNQPHYTQVVNKWNNNRSEQFFPCKWCKLWPKGIENLNKHMKLAHKTKEENSSSVEKYYEMSDRSELSNNWLYNYLDNV